MVYSIINLGFLHWYEGIGEIRVSKRIQPLALSAFVQGKIRLIVSLIVYNWFHKMTLNYFPSLCRCLEKLRNKHSLKLQVVLCLLGKGLFTLTCLSKKLLVDLLMLIHINQLCWLSYVICNYCWSACIVNYETWITPLILIAQGIKHQISLLNLTSLVAA